MLLSKRTSKRSTGHATQKWLQAEASRNHDHFRPASGLREVRVAWPHLSAPELREREVGVVNQPSLWMLLPPSHCNGGHLGASATAKFARHHHPWPGAGPPSHREQGLQPVQVLQVRGTRASWFWAPSVMTKPWRAPLHPAQTSVCENANTSRARHL